MCKTLEISRSYFYILNNPKKDNYDHEASLILDQKIILADRFPNHDVNMIMLSAKTYLES